MAGRKRGRIFATGKGKKGEGRRKKAEGRRKTRKKGDALKAGKKKRGKRL